MTGEKWTVPQFAAELRRRYPKTEGYGDIEIVREFVKRKPEVGKYIDFQDDPNIREAFSGVGAEILIGTGGQALSTAIGGGIGSVIGGPPGLAIGAGIGNVFGGLVFGGVGNIAAQKIEGREQVQKGRVVSGAIMNAIPGFKIASKVKKLPEFANRRVYNRMAATGQGALLAPTALAIEDAIDQRGYSAHDYLAASALGGIVNLGLNEASGLINKAFVKHADKTPDEIAKLADSGEPDAELIADAMAPRREKPNLLEQFFGKKPEEISRYLRPVKRFAGRDTVEAAKKYDAQRRVNFDRAVKARENLNKLLRESTPEQKRIIEDYFVRQDSLLKLTESQIESMPMRKRAAMRANLTKAVKREFPQQYGYIKETRDSIMTLQRSVLKMADAGELPSLGRYTREKIRSSLDNGGYLTVAYRFWTEPDYQPTQQARDNLFNYLTKSSEKGGGGLNEEKAQRAIDDLDAARFKKEMSMGVFDSLSTSGVNIMKRRKNLDKALKDYLGEYDDPSDKVFGTLANLGSYAAYARAKIDIRDSLLKYGIAIPASDRPKDNSSWVPLTIGQRVEEVRMTGSLQKSGPIERFIVDPQQTPRPSNVSQISERGKKEFRKTLETEESAKEYAKDLGLDTSIKSDTNPNGGIIREVVPPGPAKIKAGERILIPEKIALTLNNRLFDSTQHNHKGANIIKDIAAAMATVTKLVAVPLNLQTWSTNIIGSFISAAGAGATDLGSSNPGAVFRNLSELVKDVRGDIRDETFWTYDRKRMNRFRELDLVGTGVLAGDLRATAEAASRGFLHKKFGDGVRKGVRGITDGYSALDSAVRLSVFENYMEVLQRAIGAERLSGSPNSPIIMKRFGARRLSSGDLKNMEDFAAELTHETFQNYNRVPKGIKSFSKFGLLSEFVSFNIEQLRTTYNAARMSREMMDGRFTKRIEDRLGIKVVDQETLTNEGARRVAMQAGYLSLASQIGKISTRLFGNVDQEREQILREAVFAPWERDDSVFMSEDEDGRFTLVNMEYILPLASLTSIVDSALSERSFQDAAARAVKSLNARFGGDFTILTKALVEGVTYRDDRGDIISDIPEGDIRSLVPRALAVSKAFMPGEIKRVSDQVARPDKRLTPLELIGRYGFSFRFRAGDVERGVSYKLKELSEQVSSSNVKYINKRRYSENPREVMDAYLEANKTYQDRLARAVRISKALSKINGMNEDRVARIIQQKMRVVSISDAKAALSGRTPVLDIAFGLRSGKREERYRAYAEAINAMPPEMVEMMFNQEMDAGHLNGYDVFKVKALAAGL